MANAGSVDCEVVFRLFFAPSPPFISPLSMRLAQITPLPTPILCKAIDPHCYDLVVFVGISGLRDHRRR